MTTQLISVDFKKRQVVEKKTLGELQAQKISIADNKKLANDLKAMLDGINDRVDLYPAVLLIPNGDCDLYVKINGTDMTDADIKAVGRIHSKMRERNVKP